MMRNTHIRVSPDTFKVTITRFRADCGSFSKEIIQTVEKHCDLFYIRANNCADRYEEFHHYSDWNSVEIGYEKYDLASFDFDDFIEGKTYRLVAQRTPKRYCDGKIEKDMFGIVYVYRCIITNDWKSSDSIWKRYNNSFML